MGYQQDIEFRGAYLDFHEQGLGRELWLVTTTQDIDPVLMLEEYVTNMLSKQQWKDLSEYAGIITISHRDSLPIKLGTFFAPNYVHIKWSA